MLNPLTNEEKCMLKLGVFTAVTMKNGVVSSSPILVTLMTDALSSSETSVLTRAIRRNIPEDAIFQEKYIFVILACCTYFLK
jgi:hypothetical protein